MQFRILQREHLARVQHLVLRSFSDSHFPNIYLSPYIRSLSIEDCSASPSIINALLQYMPQLETLSINGLGVEQAIAVNDMTPRPVYTIQNMPNLKRLLLQNTEVDVTLPSNLIELKVENCGIAQYKVKKLFLTFF